MQEGNIGLLEAYKRFDSNRYAEKFWSYALQWVLGRMIYFINPNRTIESIINKIKRLPRQKVTVLGSLFDFNSKNINIFSIHR
ncbi:sigma factor [Paenibacillus terrae]